jgi:hypothetical protein
MLSRDKLVTKGGHSMTRWTRVLAGGLGLAALASCAGQSRPAPTTSAGPPTKTIVVSRGLIDPPDTTIGASQAIGFRNPSDQVLQVEFVQPEAQAGRITCRVADPKQLERGQAPWAQFHAGYQGHLVADVPPGDFPSICTFAPGYYAFTVKVMDQARPTSEKLGRQGTITVR